MQVKAIITAFLVNPDGVHEEEAELPLLPGPTGARDTALKLLTGVRMSGGFIRFLDVEAGHIEFIPLMRVRQIEIKLGGIKLADNFDMADATGRGPRIVQP